MPKIAKDLDWGTIQALYVSGHTAEDISKTLAEPGSIAQKRIASRVRTQAARKQWKARTQAALQQAQQAGNTNTAPAQTGCVTANPRAIVDVANGSNTPKMILGLLDAQRKRYMENGATLAGTVLERAAKQAESGALPVDPESLRAIGEALLPFHRIGRDVFGLGGERAAGPQVQVNIATLSDARDVQVVEVE